MGKTLGAAAVLLASLGLHAPVAAQMASDAWNGYPSPCQQATGQVEINGMPQQVAGLACLQPDGSWQMVDSAGGTLVYPQPAYYYDYGYDPWYWAPVGVGFGAGFIFVDRFHHVHAMHRVFVPRAGGSFHGGFVGAPRGAAGGFHGGGGHHH